MTTHIVSFKKINGFWYSRWKGWDNIEDQKFWAPNFHKDEAAIVDIKDKLSIQRYNELEENYHKQPLICDCESKTFEIRYGSYCVNARCSQCNHEEEIYSD